MQLPNFQVKRIVIPVDHGHLEGEFFLPEHSNGWLLFSHPHPLYGGSMYQPLVVRVCQQALTYGWGSLRFNFRGVGHSTGTYSGGNGEIDDFAAAFRYLQEQQKGPPIAVGGYSFGAWVSYAWLRRHPHAACAWLGIAPPLEILPLKPMHSDIPRWLIYGERDPFIPADQVEAWVRRSRGSVTLRVIPDADHFFSHHEPALDEVLNAFFVTLSPPAPARVPASIRP